MQMRGCRNRNIRGDNKAAGAASCPRPPSHCRTVGEHPRGAAAAAQGPPQCWQHCPCAPRHAPTQERPRGAVGWVSAPAHGIALQPGQDPPAQRARAGCRGEAHPVIIQAFPTSSFILRHHQATSGVPGIVHPPPSPPTLAGAPQGLGAPRQQPCAGCRDAPGTEVELTGLGLVLYGALNPLRRPGGNSWPTPALPWLFTAPPAPRRCLVSTKGPPLQWSRMGRRTHREVQPSPLPSPKILARP